MVGNRQVTTKDLTRDHPLALGAGRPYSLRSLENDRNQILAAYLNRGFLNVGMDTKVEPAANDPHKMNVTYTIQEGPQVDVASLVYLGNDRTRTAFLQKIMAKNVIQGNALSEGRLLTSESDLYNLGIFDWTSVRTRRPVKQPEPGRCAREGARGPPQHPGLRGRVGRTSGVLTTCLRARWPFRDCR